MGIELILDVSGNKESIWKAYMETHGFTRFEKKKCSC